MAYEIISVTATTLPDAIVLFKRDVMIKILSGWQPIGSMQIIQTEVDHVTWFTCVREMVKK